MDLLTSVLGKLAKLALDKILELYGVRSQVEFLGVELELIQGILQDNDSKPYNSNARQRWMNQLKRVAERIDEIIETYQNENEKYKSKGFNFKPWKKPLHLNVLSDEIGKIREILKILKEYGNQPCITATDLQLGDILVAITASGEFKARPLITASGTGTEDSEVLEQTSAPQKPFLPFGPTKPSDIDDPEVVGLDSDKDNIIRHLLDESISRRTVLSIVGVGGLGKTTLAKKVYNSSELKGRFQCCAWVFISQEFNENNILREILYSIEPIMKYQNPLVEDKDLQMKVKSSLSYKRYLIILDDVWGEDVWERLQKALPDANNNSRVIITTRDIDVAATADRITDPYKPCFLTNDESLALLFRTAFRCDINPKDYPVALKGVALRLIKKCGGLPLALVVLGGILSTIENTLAAWKSVEEITTWHDDDDDDGKKCMEILNMSYENLPYHLKQCFLYFASFPEDHKISAKHMTRMWVAEELIPKDGARSLEDESEKCLQELVERCFVQVAQKAWNGSCKYCCLHDLIRVLAIQKAEEENFFTVFSEGTKGARGKLQLAPSRVALQFDTPTDIYGIHSTKYTRSLLCFGEYISNYQGFEKLRVLVFERVDMSQKGISSSKKWLEGLLHLKYLGFRYCRDMRKGFKTISFSGLRNLEILDCKGTYICDNPSLWKIPVLRHVITGDDSMINWPSNWDHLKNLETFKTVDLETIPTAALPCNVNLCTLKVATLDNTTSGKTRQRLQALLSQMEHLVSFTACAKNGVLPFPSVFSCHEKLESLGLVGKLQYLNVEMFPRNLIKLKLEDTMLRKDPMSILERLPRLRILQLLHESYEGRKMVCSTRGFPSLKKLKLQDLPELSDWKIEEGAMSNLSHLEINSCIFLDRLPELQNVSRLKELIVIAASDQLHKRSQTEDRYKIEHIPSVHIEMPSRYASD